MLKDRWDVFVSALDHPIAQGLARTVTEIHERPPKGETKGAVYLLFPNRRLQTKAAQYRPCFVECASRLLSHPISIEFVVVPFSIPSHEKSKNLDDIDAIAQSLAQAMEGEVLEGDMWS
ncbi:MAG: hypothetical protein WCA07_17155 [Gloeobacterales cyanobacterium]